EHVDRLRRPAPVRVWLARWRDGSCRSRGGGPDSIPQGDRRRGADGVGQPTAQRAIDQLLLRTEAEACALLVRGRRGRRRGVARKPGYRRRGEAGGPARLARAWRIP